MRVLIAIGHSDARIALELLLSQEPGLNIVGTTGDMQSMLALTQTCGPDLVVLEWDLPGRPQSEVMDESFRFAGRPHFVVLGRRAGQRQPALDAGVQAFVAIGDPPEQLLTAVRRVRARLYMRKGNE